MAEVTIERLAAVVGISVERLLQQLKSAGINKTSSAEVVSLEEKQGLLDYLKHKHGGDDKAKDKKSNDSNVLKKTVNKIKTPPGNKGKVINIAVRKKRTFEKKDASSKQKPDNKDRGNKRKPHPAGTKPEIKKPQDNKDRKDRKSDSGSSSKFHKKKPASVMGGNASPPTDRFVDHAIPAADTRRSRKKSNKHKDKYESDNFKSKYSDKKGRNEFKDEWRNKRSKYSKNTSETVSAHGFTKPTSPVIRAIDIPESIVVAELANRMAVKAADVIKTLFKMGSMATINQVIDQETACIIVEEMGHRYKLVKTDDLEDSILETHNDETHELMPRDPVVTVMGHVDHGKTSLLDYIRKAKVRSAEAGGITQHIGAYHVATSQGGISFLDTPGHAAFTAMRARGAKVTDIVILVVAADDGVMPQTEEAIQHAKAAKIPIIVAVNKMDKPEADIERVKNELSGKGVIPEDWGGDTQFMPISALTGEGIEELLEAISLQAELLELKAAREGLARGVVLESRIDKGRGVVTTVLIQSGMLKHGDYILAGHNSGRIRVIIDENGNTTKSALPSIPVEVLGFDGAPGSGDELIVLNDDRKIREIAGIRQAKFREGKLARQQAVNLENLMHSMKSSVQKKKILNIVLKADVKGSLEALTDSLQKLGNDEVCVNVISFGVGGITETDANLALASQAIIIGFNVRSDALSRKIIEAEQLDLRYYSVIYNVLQDVEKALSGMLGSDAREEICGIAEVRQVFSGAKFGQIAGCMVVEGIVYRNKHIRVLRNDVVIFEGELESLKHYKEDVNEIRQGKECGIAVKGYNDVKPGDKIEVFQVIQVKRTL